VRYTPEATVSIERGENAGRDITYVNIVRDWVLAAEWDGRRAISFTPNDLGDDAWVVIVQEGTTGPLLAAQQLQ